MSSKKLLAILGSPHPRGTTAAMLDCAVRSAEHAGYDIAKINLYEKQLGFCSGCRACLQTSVCVQKDDLQEIAVLLKECNAVVLATPVYWANVPAPVKNLFDRLLGVAMEETDRFPKPRLSGKQYILLTSCKTPDPFAWIFGQTRGALRNMNEFFKTAGMKCAGKFVCTNTAKIDGLTEALVKKLEKCWR